MAALSSIVQLDHCPLTDIKYCKRCKDQLDQDGVLVISNFLTLTALNQIQREGEQQQPLAYYTANEHNVYLLPPDHDLPDDHPRNRLVNSSKGCITTDQIPLNSPLLDLYQHSDFRQFLCTVLDQERLYEYADPLSSINLHYASEGQELGWHFDNSSFAITLLIRQPQCGGEFEYVKDVRNAQLGEMNYQRASDILDGSAAIEKIPMEPGTLILFRGQNSMHRVTPVIGDTTRMLVVLAYNTEPGVALSESARMTFSAG